VLQRKSIFLLLILFFIVGCSQNVKYDFKLENVSLRNIRNKYLALDLKFDRTLRSISKDDKINISYEVYPKDGNDPFEGKIENITGMKLEDDFLLSGVDSFDPKDYYKVWVSISRENKVITANFFLLEEEIAQILTKDEFEILEPEIEEENEEEN
jgi:hypothetical protein